MSPKKRSEMTPEELEHVRKINREAKRRYYNKYGTTRENKPKRDRLTRVQRLCENWMETAHQDLYFRLLEEYKVVARVWLTENKEGFIRLDHSRQATLVYNKARAMALRALRERYHDEWEGYRLKAKAELDAGADPVLLFKPRPRSRGRNLKNAERASKLYFKNHIKDAVAGRISVATFLEDLKEKIQS